MKTLILSLVFILSTSALAQSLDRKVEALIRTDNNRPVVDEVILTDLVSAESFDGLHFKIVQGKSDEAIRFDQDEELTFRAATAYYHLTKARDYFVYKVKSEYAASIPKMVIRIDHKNQFSELGHFAHDNLEPQFNNALTIPAGKGLASKGVKPWGMVLMKQFRNQIHMQSLQRFMSQGVMALTRDNPGMNPFSVESLVRTVGSSVIMEAGYQFLEPISKVFSRKWYWLDTALVPEIIYHEYAHAALSDHLVLSHSTAIIEGMADFFAGQIANSPKLATHIKKYNTYNGKNAKKKKEYMIQFESADYANTDFVFGMLWELKKIVGEDKGEAFMFELRKKVTTNSSIRVGLIEGILETCEEMCTVPFVDKIRILKALNLKGL
jgi:hypothetical protein